MIGSLRSWPPRLYFTLLYILLYTLLYFMFTLVYFCFTFALLYFHFALFFFALLYFTLICFALLFFALLCFILFCVALLCFTLLYFYKITVAWVTVYAYHVIYIMKPAAINIIKPLSILLNGISYSQSVTIKLAVPSQRFGNNTSFSPNVFVKQYICGTYTKSIANILASV